MLTFTRNCNLSTKTDLSAKMVELTKVIDNVDS